MQALPENSLPLSSYQFLSEEDPLDAEKQLAQDIEQRQIIPYKNTPSNSINGNRFCLEETQLFCLQFDAPMQVKAEKLKSVNMIFPLSGKLSVGKNHSGELILPGSARIDSPGDQLDVTWITDCRFMVVRIPEETLYSYCRKLYDCDTAKGISFEKLMNTQAAPGSSVSNILRTILTEADTPDSLLNRGQLTQSFEETLVMAILHAQPHSLSQVLQNSSCQVRPSYIKRAIDYIQENAADEIALSTLVDISGVSLRSLQAGFSKHYDMGPKTYIKNIKLHKAREDLVAGDPVTTSIGDVAAKWGFYNACNFSVNYRKLFGETPSKTLRALKGICRVGLPKKRA